MTRTFSDGHPKVLPACNFLSQYYFYNIFLQKSCRFSLQTLRKFEVAKTGSGVGFLRLTAVWVSAARSSDRQSLVLDRKRPPSNIEVRGNRWLLLLNSFLAVGAMISSLNSSLWASLMMSTSVSANSFAINSPLIRCSLGALQFLIKRLTQLLTRTSWPLEETRYHLENLAGFKSQFFFSVVTKVNVPFPNIEFRSLPLVLEVDSLELVFVQLSLLSRPPLLGSLILA